MRALSAPADSQANVKRGSAFEDASLSGAFHCRSIACSMPGTPCYEAVNDQSISFCRIPQNRHLCVPFAKWTETGAQYDEIGAKPVRGLCAANIGFTLTTVRAIWLLVGTMHLFPESLTMAYMNSHVRPLYSLSVIGRQPATRSKQDTPDWDTWQAHRGTIVPALPDPIAGRSDPRHTSSQERQPE